MHLLRLRLTSFRTHSSTDVALCPKINLFVGPNGAGKTNLLEATHALCLSKSFLTATDTVLVQRGREHFEVEGVFESERRSALKAKLVFAAGQGKRLFLNGAPLERLSSIAGELPVVVLSPADYNLTAGGPEERRRFLDALLSQAYPVYLADLIKYRRALKQRNALLQQVRRGARLAPGTLAAWDEELVTLGARLIYRRAQFLERFSAFLGEAYRMLEAVGEEPTLEYQTVPPPDGLGTIEVIEEAFRARVAEVERREAERGRTLLGPHLDEIVIRLGGFEVRPYASQGQHRTVGLAVRLASFLYLEDRLGETPLLLLDDVFGTLDTRRAQVLMALLQSDAVGQSLVTSARSEPFEGAIRFDDDDHQAFWVEAGAVSALDSLLSTLPLSASA